MPFPHASVSYDSLVALVRDNPRVKGSTFPERVRQDISITDRTRRVQLFEPREYPRQLAGLDPEDLEEKGGIM